MTGEFLNWIVHSVLYLIIGRICPSDSSSFTAVRLRGPVLVDLALVRRPVVDPGVRNRGEPRERL